MRKRGRATVEPLVHNEIEKLRQLKKRQYLLLTELDGLTGQLAQATDRKDQVSVKMVLAMRQGPMAQLQEIEDTIRAQLQAMPEDVAIRMGALLNGKAAQGPEEEELCKQVAQNQRILQKVTELDQRISLRLGGKRSIYQKFRP